MAIEQRDYRSSKLTFRTILQITTLSTIAVTMLHSWIYQSPTTFHFFLPLSLLPA